MKLLQLFALLTLLSVTAAGTAQGPPGGSKGNKTGSQAKHLPSPYRVPPDKGDPPDAYRFGPAHTTGKTTTNSPFPKGSGAPTNEPRRLPARTPDGRWLHYFIENLGTDKVNAWAEANGQPVNDPSLKQTIQARSNGSEDWPSQDFFDQFTGLQWNWVGSSRSGGVQVKPCGIGDVNVTWANVFDGVARNHDIQTWIDIHFETNATIHLKVRGDWVRYRPMGGAQHAAVITSFQTAVKVTLARAERVAQRFGCQSLLLKVTLDRADFNLNVLGRPFFLKKLFGDWDYRRYMTDEFAQAMDDFSARLNANAAWRQAVAESLRLPANASADDVMHRFLDPYAPMVQRGSAWEKYLIARENALDMNDLQKNFVLVDMATPGGEFVSIGFGRPSYYEGKLRLLLDADKLRQLLKALPNHEARLKQRGITVPATLSELLGRVQVCTPTSADAEELRGYIRRKVQTFGLRDWLGAQTYQLAQAAWGQDDAVIFDRLLNRVVRGPR